MKNLLYRHPYILHLLLLALLAHGLLLINDGIYWESWNVHTNYVMVGGNPDAHRIVDIDGRVFSRLIYREIIAYIFRDFNFGFKLAGFLSILVSGIVIYVLSGHMTALTQLQRFWLSAFTLASPYQVLTIDYVYAQYSLDLMLFYVATLLAIWPNNLVHLKLVRLFLRIVALVLFLLSFSTGSLLVFYVLAFIFLVIVAAQKSQTLSQSNSGILQQIGLVLKQTAKHLDFLLLPILFWLVVRILFPQTAYWIQELGYNQLNPSVLFDHTIWANFFYVASIALINNAIQFHLAWPFAVGIILIYVARRIIELHNRPSSTKFIANVNNVIITLGIGIISLVIAILPYIAVGREIYPDNFLNNLLRYFLLVPLPIAIMCIAFSRLFSKYSLMLVLLAFVYTDLDLYFVYQARYVKDLSVKQHLVVNAQLNTFSIVRVIDQYPTDNRFPINWGQDFAFEQTAYFRWILNTDTWPVSHSFKDGEALTRQSIIVPWIESSPAMIKYMHLQKLDVLGCYGQLVISKSDYAGTLTPMSVSLRYWYYRFLQPNNLTNWLKTLSYVTLQSVNIAGTSNCKAIPIT